VVRYHPRPAAGAPFTFDTRRGLWLGLSLSLCCADDTPPQKPPVFGRDALHPSRGRFLVQQL
jgi:hypothetical protein